MRILTVPNVLTVVRIVLTPVVLGLLLSEWFLAGSILYTIVLITDLLDGLIARAYKQSSRFGAFLDPVADKLMVITCLLYVVHYYDNIYLFILAYLLVIRELLVMALRQWLSGQSQGRSGVLLSSWLAKSKTFFQGFAFIFFFYSLTDFFSTTWHVVGIILLEFSLVLGLLSMLKYFEAFIRASMKDKKN